MARGNDQSPTNHLHEDTTAIIGKERERRNRQGDRAQSKAIQQWQHAAALALRPRSRAHYKNHINVSTREHMSGVDCFDGSKARRGRVADKKNGNDDGPAEEDLPTIHPVVDGRLKDEGAAKMVE